MPMAKEFKWCDLIIEQKKFLGIKCGPKTFKKGLRTQQHSNHDLQLSLNDRILWRHVFAGAEKPDDGFDEKSQDGQSPSAAKLSRSQDICQMSWDGWSTSQSIVQWEQRSYFN